MSNIIVRQTTESFLIKKILTDTELYKLISEDIGELSSDIDFSLLPNFYFLEAIKDDETIGIYVGHYFNNTTLQGHINILPSHWGDNVEVTGLCIEWVWNNTDYQKIIGFIPEDASVVIAHAISAGFSEEGRLKNSVVFNGNLQDQVIVGINK